MLDLTTGELRQALKQCSDMLEDYVAMYNKEYERSALLQSRIDRLKTAQSKAHLVFKGSVE